MLIDCLFCCQDAPVDELRLIETGSKGDRINIVIKHEIRSVVLRELAERGHVYLR